MTSKIAILGAGSIGCYVGGCLIDSGSSVVLIGRPSYRDMTAKHGLTLTHFDHDERYVVPNDIDFAVDPQALSGCDVIIVCVKSADSAQAGGEIAEHAKTNAIVVSLQNGVGNTQILTQNAPQHTILAAMVPNNVLGMDEGRFHFGTDGDVIIEDHPRTQALADALNAAKIPAKLSADMVGVQWGKLLLNLGNSINALSGKTYLEQLSDRDMRRVMAAAIDETLAVLKQAGIKPMQVGKIKPKNIPKLLRLPDWLYGPVMARSIKIDATARSSMWQDLMANRQSEVDYLNGAVIDLGKKAGVKTPVNMLLTQLTHAMFEAGQSPQMSGKTLWDMTTAQISNS